MKDTGMDWAEDSIGISHQDFHRVWKYKERDSTVVRLMETDEVRQDS